MKWSAFGGNTASPLFEIAPQLEWLLIQFELLLAVWLLIGWLPLMAWGTTLVLFTSFAGASLMMVIQGRSTCGCLGTIDFNPAWMLLFDLAAICVLFGAFRSLFGANKRPDRTLSHESQRLHSSHTSQPVFEYSRRSTTRKLGLASALAIVGFVTALVVLSRTPQISSWVARSLPPQCSGQYLLTEPAVVDAGIGGVNQWVTMNVRVHNRSAGPVTLIGAEKGCKCRADDNLPITIAADERAEIKIEIRLGRTEGIQQDRFWLRTSLQQQPLILCRWQGRVVLGNQVKTESVPEQARSEQPDNDARAQRHLNNLL